MTAYDGREDDRVVKLVSGTGRNNAENHSRDYILGRLGQNLYPRPELDRQRKRRLRQLCYRSNVGPSPELPI